MYTPANRARLASYIASQIEQEPRFEPPPFWVVCMTDYLPFGGVVIVALLVVLGERGVFG